MNLRIYAALLAGWVIPAGMVSAASDNAAAARVSAAYNQLGFRLIAALRTNAPGQNVFVSPEGLAFALSMAARGARGQTLAEMRSVLNLTAETDPDAANKAFLENQLGLNVQYGRDSNDGVRLEIANSLWIDKSAKINPDFTASCGEFYQAKAATVDFQQPAAADLINQWVDGKTHGRIQKMVAPPLGGTRLLLLDAVYFKANWLQPFDPERTHDAPFHLNGGAATNVPMMSREAEMEYCETDVFQAVRLPYAPGKVEAVVLLPKKSLMEWVPQLTTQNWRQWFGGFQRTKVRLSLPRFKVDCDADLGPVLASLGMPTPFSVRADFSGMARTGLKISAVRQKAYLHVDEKGTEATAATAVLVHSLAIRRTQEPVTMMVDHPFFFAIRAVDTDSILFAGAIENPRP